MTLGKCLFFGNRSCQAHLPQAPPPFHSQMCAKAFLKLSSYNGSSKIYTHTAYQKG